MDTQDTTANFPLPIKLTPYVSRWLPDDIHRWEAERGITGLPALEKPASRKEIAERYNIGYSTLRRWVADARTKSEKE